MSWEKVVVYEWGAETRDVLCSEVPMHSAEEVVASHAKVIREKRGEHRQPVYSAWG